MVACFWGSNWYNTGDSQQMKYEIAISYRRINRPYVQDVATHLLELGFNKSELFFDKFHEAKGVGQDGKKYFSEIFSQTFCAVVFISKEYLKSDWTKIEFNAAKGGAEYMMPFLLDNATPNYLPDGIIRMDVHQDKGTPQERSLTPKELAEVIKEQYDLQKKKAPESNKFKFMDNTASVDADSIINMGNQLYLIGDYKSAIQLYSVAIDLQPTNVKAYYNRSLAHIFLDKFKLAKDDLDKAIALNPKHPAANYNRGWIGIKYGHFKKAIEYFNVAIDNNPTHPFAHYYRGRAKAGLSKWNDALVDLEQSTKLNPTDPDGYFDLGGVLDELNRLEDAIVCYDRTIELKPDYDKAFNNRGKTKLTMGKPKVALSDFNNAISLNKSIPEYYFNRGLAFAKLRDNNRALNDFITALTKSSDPKLIGLVSKKISEMCK